MGSGPETTLVRNIRTAILREYPNAWIFKVHGSPYQTVGTPDLLVCVAGRLVGMEVKAQRPGESAEHALGRVTPAQHAQIGEILASGGVAGPVLSVADALDLIKVAIGA